jgi:hypothetical protein
MGNAADSVEDALTAFDNELWAYIDSLDSCSIINTAIKGPVYDNTLRIYPDPANDVLYFKTDRSSEFGSIVISDILGEIVAVYPYSDQISIGQLPSAMYIIRVSDSLGNFVKTMKIIKE